MNEQLSERGKGLVKYMPHVVNALADRLIEKLGERLFYGEKQQTNADRIRAMSDEELADFLWSIGSNPITGNYYLNGRLLFFCGDGNGWLDWLKQEAD